MIALLTKVILIKTLRKAVLLFNSTVLARNDKVSRTTRSSGMISFTSSFTPLWCLAGRQGSQDWVPHVRRGARAWLQAPFEGRLLSVSVRRSICLLNRPESVCRLCSWCWNFGYAKLTKNELQKWTPITEIATSFTYFTTTDIQKYSERGSG